MPRADQALRAWRYGDDGKLDGLEAAHLDRLEDEDEPREDSGFEISEESARFLEAIQL